MSADLDNGYTRIANEILEGLSALELSGREFRVVTAIMRKTYGFQKRVDWISLEQLSDITGIAKENISRLVGRLVDKRIILKEGAGYTKKLGMNTAIKEWFHVEQIVENDNGDDPKQQNVESDKMSETTTENVNSDNQIVNSDNGDVRKRQPQKKKETLPKETITKESPPAAGRGCRLVEVVIPDDWRSWALSEGHSNPDREFSIFRDYWISQPGQKGVKTDWLATWRNWIRRSMQSRQTGPPPKRHNDFENRDYTAGVTSDGTF